MDFSTLKNLVVGKPSDIKSSSKGGLKKIPTTGDFLITKSGKIVFSEVFRNSITKLDSEGNPEELKNFLDFVDGRSMNPSINFMLMAIVEGDVIKSKRASIKQEGKVSFIDNFFKQIANGIYGCNWENNDVIEFKILYDHEITTNEPRFYFPFVNQKGEPTYNKRDKNTTKVYPVVPVSLLEKKVDAVQQELDFQESKDVAL